MAYCPECGARVQRTAGLCKSCGHVLVWEEVQKTNTEKEIQQTKPRKKRRPSKCAEHPQNKSIGRCAKCGKVVCNQCSTSFINTLYCLSCIDEIMNDMPMIEEQPKRLPRRRHEARKLEQEQGKSGTSRGGKAVSVLWSLYQTIGITVMFLVGIVIIGLILLVIGLLCWSCVNPHYEPGDYEQPPRPWAYISPVPSQAMTGIRCQQIDCSILELNTNYIREEAQKFVILQTDEKNDEINKTI